MRAADIVIRERDVRGFLQYAITPRQILDLSLFPTGLASEMLGPGRRIIREWIDHRRLKNIPVIFSTNSLAEEYINAKSTYRRTSLRELLRAASDLKAGLKEPRPFDERLWLQLGFDRAHDPCSRRGRDLITEAALQAINDLAEGKIKQAEQRLKTIDLLLDCRARLGPDVRYHFADGSRLVDQKGMQHGLHMAAYPVASRYIKHKNATAKEMMIILWDLVGCKSRKCFGDLCLETSCPLFVTMRNNYKTADRQLQELKEELRHAERELEQARERRLDYGYECEYEDRMHRR